MANKFLRGGLPAVMMLFFVTGCGTSFKYTPRHDQSYAAAVNGVGLAIRTGQDLRAEEEKRPRWTKNAEGIVARAVADEVKHGKLFQRVKIHMDSVNTTKFSEIVRFRVKKFECYNQPAFLEGTGRRLLQIQGIRGALIAESIPSKYISEVEIEFEVLDAAAQRSVFTKTYKASRTGSANGYQGETPQVQQTSAALEAVVTQFVGDLAKLGK